MPQLQPTPFQSRASKLRRGDLACAALIVGMVATLLGAKCQSRYGADGVAGGEAGPNPAGGHAATSSAPAVSSPAVSSPAVSTPAVSGAEPSAGRTIDVRMVGDASGYRFVPATVTIRTGDTVRWTNVSGGPHNVTFWADSIPAGAGDRLQTSMQQTMSPLSSQLLTTPNATYAVSFAGLPAGTYAYYCTPHLALGMRATIVVEP